MKDVTDYGIKKDTENMRTSRNERVIFYIENILQRSCNTVLEVS